MPEERTSGVIQRLLENESAFRQFVRRRVGEEVIVEDILQQSFTKAVERSHSVNNEHSALAWFYQILRHTIRWRITIVPMERRLVGTRPSYRN